MNITTGRSWPGPWLLRPEWKAQLSLSPDGQVPDVRARDKEIFIEGDRRDVLRWPRISSAGSGRGQPGFVGVWNSEIALGRRDTRMKRTVMSGKDSDLLIYATALIRTASAELDNGDVRGKTHMEWTGREPKAAIDRRLHKLIVHGLSDTGIPILSEEADHSAAWRSKKRTWIVDPLDGTLNLIRGAGPSAISICLWEGEGPVFGVVFDTGSRQIFWGGKAGGAWGTTGRLAVSEVAEVGKGVLCTGIPAGFDFSDRNAVEQWVRTLALFGKIRMMGSAASMLLMVARGAVDCYYERNIQIWDVAAGIALVEGAGGTYRICPSPVPTMVTVVASNAVMMDIVQPNLLQSAP